jgi:hypothetical protein
LEHARARPRRPGWSSLERARGGGGWVEVPRAHQRWQGSNSPACARGGDDWVDLPARAPVAVELVRVWLAVPVRVVKH